MLMAAIAVAMGFIFPTAAKLPAIAPSYSWKLLPPLGLHQPAEIDTLYTNYSLRFIPQTVSPAYAATGNYCAEGYNMIYFDRAPVSDFMFRDAISHWVPDEDKIRYYNTRIPMTLLGYSFGGGKENGQDDLSVVFSGNANKRLQIGAMLDYIYSKGMYANQAAKDFTWGLSGSYIGERFEAQVYGYHFALTALENGGITDDLYITDPAEVQGGQNSVQAKQIPTRLNAAQNRIQGSEIYFNGRYKIGFYEDEQVNDTTVVEHLVPVTSIIYTLKYRDGRRRFKNNNATENLEFWDNTYFNPTLTNDLQSYWSLRNTVGVSLLEGFNKYAKAGLAAYATYEVRKYKMETAMADPDQLATGDAQLLTPLPDINLPDGGSQNLMWIGAQLTKQQGRILNYDITGELGLVGEAAGEIKVDGGITTRIPLFGDTVNIAAKGKFTNLSAPWLMKHYISNHFVWDNDFSKTRTFRVGGEIYIPWTLTRFSAGVENIQNALYFNDQALPRQFGGNVQIFSATLRQDIHAGCFHWENRITYQTSSDKDVIPLPQLAVNSNMYVTFRIATLRVQLGLDCDYFTRYKPVSFQPATMQFYNADGPWIGNYPFMNFYINCRLSKTRFYLMMSHVNQGLTGDNYFSMPHYPMNPRRLQLGLSIDFAN
ncbi:MAG: putative porin [Muribaculaceae bacterium]|nr:putative porin [Muribaculaceae bacterium]